MSDLLTYVPDDQEAHLGPPPWNLHDEAAQEWEQAHNHDPRTKCYVEYGCQALADHYDWLLDEVERLRDHTCGVSIGCLCEWDDVGNPVGGQHRQGCPESPERTTDPDEADT